MARAVLSAARNRIILLLTLWLAGCAVHQTSAPGRTTPPGGALRGMNPRSTPSAGDPKADLTLDQIEPLPATLAASQPSTAPSQPPPLDAVRLFARSRIALHDGHYYEAVALLQHAAELDPQSFELHQSLGDAYASAGDRRATAQWEAASAIEPDHLALQISLGRSFLAQEKLSQAIRHLRLAQRTEEYRQGDPASGEADFLLARALQQGGYDRASLQMYERLLARLQNPSFAARANPQLAVLLSHPEALALSIAALYEKHGAYQAATSLLESVAARNPHSFELQAQLARDALALAHRDEAMARAADAARLFHGDAQSVSLLRQVAGGDAAATRVLRQLAEKDPDDRLLTGALFDLLVAQGRTAEASQVLDRALKRWPDDLRLVRRRVDLLRRTGDFPSAAAEVVDALGRRPDHDSELKERWDRLLQPSAAGRLTLKQISALATSPNATAAKMLLLSRAAELWHHDALQQGALRQAVDARPVFAPAWRQQILSIWSEEVRTRQQKRDQSERLATAADQTGQPALAAELRGLALLQARQWTQAASALASAAKLGDRSPELFLSFALALHGSENDRFAQSLLLKLIDEHPLCGEAYIELYAIYTAHHDARQAHEVIAKWEEADPDSSAARRLEARDDLNERHLTDAERILLGLLDENDSDAKALDALVQFYSETGRLKEITAKLERRLASEPWNFTLGTVLAETYAQRQLVVDANRVLDTLRSRAAGDADLLYTLSGLYTRIGNKDQSERILAEVLKLDPSYTGASNDLGYSYAEQGKNLPQAEDLVRRALRDEPGNPAFLDSMGWVLYKRGRFDEALQNLSQALPDPQQADPVVLDHLGDTLYRLGQRREADAKWRQALRRLDELRETSGELRDLRIQLAKKRQQLDAGQPVSVAPVVETSAMTSTTQPTTTSN